MTGINLTYMQLITNFPPRPITSDEHYWETQAYINELLDKSELSVAEQDYLTMLGMVIEQYEDAHEPDIEMRGIDLIRALMNERGLRQRDLVKPIFKTDSIASEVLNRKRRLTVEHIDKLAAFFGLPHELFFEHVVAEQSNILSGVKRNKQRIRVPSPKSRPSVFVKFIDQLSFDNTWRYTPPTHHSKVKQFCLNDDRIRGKAKV